MELDSLSQAAIEEFPWESVAQKEGFLNYWQYERQNGIIPALPIFGQYRIVLYFIQKQHEAAEYWQHTFATQVKDLQDKLMDLGQQYDNVHRLNQILEVAVRAHQTALENIQTQI